MKDFLGVLIILIAASAAPVTAGEPSEFKHMEEIKTCGLCHSGSRSEKSRHHLHMLDGEPLSENPVVAPLCGQCHGIRFREWKIGVHGKVTGHWDAGSGEKTRWDCVQCHEAHSPRFKPMKAVEAPVLPKFGRKEEGGH